MKNQSNTRLAVLALVLLITLWSCNWIVMKSVMQYIGPLDFVALRCSSGALLLFLLLRVTGRSLAPPPLIPAIAIGLFQTVGMMGISQLALVTGGAGSTAVLAYTLPFWMILLAVPILGEKITKAQAAAIIFAAIGMLLVIQPWNGMGTLLSSCLAVLSGFLWALGSILAKWLYRKHAEVDTLNLTAWQMLFGGIVIVIAALLTHEKPIVWSGYLFFALTYNALLTTALCWVLWLFVLRVLPTNISGLSMLFVPVCSVLLAWILLDEVPDPAKLLGIICITAGLLLSTGAVFTIHKLLLKTRSGG